MYKRWGTPSRGVVGVWQGYWARHDGPPSLFESRPGTPSRFRSTQTVAATAQRFLLRSVATSRFSATRVDINPDRVTTFLAVHPGQFFCNECLIEAVPGLNRPQVTRLTRRLRDVKRYRWGKVVCVNCGEVRECIAYGSSDLARHGYTRAQGRGSFGVLTRPSHSARPDHPGVQSADQREQAGDAQGLVQAHVDKRRRYTR